MRGMGGHQCRCRGTGDAVHSAAMDGVINLDKPAGISSAFAVKRVKRLLPRGTKIGHAGTLDPFATGVLVLLIGKATRLCERLMNSPKQYEAAIKLGAVTATLDPDSPEEPCPPSTIPIALDVQAAASGFVGEIEQAPPAFSALKIAGRPAYELARKGQPVRLEPRRVHIYGIELLGYDWPMLRIRVDCGRGTYIRALARDLGEALHTAGYLAELRRTRVGEYAAAGAVGLDAICAQGVEKHLLPPPA